MRRLVVDQWLPGQEVKAAVRRSTGRALALVALQAAGYLACTAAALAPLPYSLNLLFGVLAGHGVAILFTVGHDACHQALTPSMWLNRWIGRVVFIPSLHAVSLWVLGHNRIHHGSTRSCLSTRRTRL